MLKNSLQTQQQQQAPSMKTQKAARPVENQLKNQLENHLEDTQRSPANPLSSYKAQAAKTPNILVEIQLKSHKFQLENPL